MSTPPPAPWTDVALRRRRLRRVNVVGLPAVVLLYLVSTGRAPSWTGLLALSVLALVVAVGWWWVARAAGDDPWRVGLHPAGDDRVWLGELDDARAEWAVRHHRGAGPSQRRAEDMALRWERDSLWSTPVLFVLGVVWTFGLIRGDVVPDGLLMLPLVALLVAAVVRQIRRGLWARRWLRDTPSEDGSPALAADTGDVAP